VFRFGIFLAFAATLAGIAVHYLTHGRRRTLDDEGPRELGRFGLLERLVHGVVTLAFCAAAVTGFVPALMGRELSGWWLLLHDAAGATFAAFSAVLVVIWADDCLVPCQRVSARIARGETKGGLALSRAARFNTRQKAFFWFVAVCAFFLIGTGLLDVFPVLSEKGQLALVQTHKFFALLLLIAVIAHFYLTVLANPGMWRGMVQGYVSRAWAAFHHPLWLETLDLQSLEGETENDVEKNDE